MVSRSTKHSPSSLLAQLSLRKNPSLHNPRDSQTHENQPAEYPSETQSKRDIPAITIEDPDQNRRVARPSSSSSTEKETRMSSSSHRSSHHSSSSSSKSKHSSSHSSSHSKSKSQKDDWSEITDPEERRRVQNRIAQRKFRDKAKETKERQDREASDRQHAGHSYHTPDPSDLGPDDQELSGLPWGSLSLRHVVSKGKAKEEESRHGSRSYEERSHYDERSSYYAASPQEPIYDSRGGSSTYYEQEPYYEEDVPDRVYYDYGSGGSGHGGSSR